ncbi:MAG: hypothetical protein EOM25_09455 [Deltaproteobacteria bacterium]|nr:hypothetical protein [Deltaproteobacteria bacterium]
MPDRVKIWITLAGYGFVLSGVIFWWHYTTADARRSSWEQDVAQCQSEITARVRSHDERLRAIESWLESNRRMPEVLAKVETNTANMSNRIGEILIEIRELRGKRQ